jgi:hypothetical protein
MAVGSEVNRKSDTKWSRVNVNTMRSANATDEYLETVAIMSDVRLIEWERQRSEMVHPSKDGDDVIAFPHVDHVRSVIGGACMPIRSHGCMIVSVSHALIRHADMVDGGCLGYFLPWCIHVSHVLRRPKSHNL